MRQLDGENRSEKDEHRHAKFTDSAMHCISGGMGQGRTAVIPNRSGILRKDYHQNRIEISSKMVVFDFC